MKELDSLCQAILEKKIKSLQKCIDLHQEDLVTAKELYGWRKITNYINQNAGINLKETFLTNMFYRSLKNNTTALKSAKVTLRENTTVEKKSSTTTIEKSDNSSIDFSNFTNLNPLSKKLISDHNLTLDDLNEIGIKGISDKMTVYNKINRFCEGKVSLAKREKYQDIMKKD